MCHVSVVWSDPSVLGLETWADIPYRLRRTFKCTILKRDNPSVKIVLPMHSHVFVCTFGYLLLLSIESTLIDLGLLGGNDPRRLQAWTLVNQKIHMLLFLDVGVSWMRSINLI